MNLSKNSLFSESTPSAPLLSVCIPVLNGGNYLAEAIASARASVGPNFELCISDNCSTDATHKICKSAQPFPGLSYSRSHTQISGADNWKRVVNMATGRWIVVIGHDDLLEPHTVSTLTHLVSLFPNNRIVVSVPTYIDQDGSPSVEQLNELSHIRETVSMPRSVFLDRLVCGMLVPPTGIFFHESLLQECGTLSTALRGCADWEFLLRISAGSDVTISPKSLTKYRRHGGQDSHDFVLGEHLDPEIMQEKMLSYAHLNDGQRTLMMKNMSAFLFRSLTMQLLSQRRSIDDVLRHRKIVQSRFAAWQADPRIRKFLPRKKFLSFKNRIVWCLTKYKYTACLARPLVRVAVRLQI